MKPQSTWIFALFLLLTFFSAGGAVVESFVNYPTWLLIGEAEFKAYHQALGPRIVATMVLPLLASTVFNVLLFWFRPTRVPRWSVWLTLGLVLMVWVSTATLELPIQNQLGSTGFSREAIERLIATDLPFRTIPGLVRVGITFWMLLVVLRPAISAPAAIAPLSR
jgi:hypothetical protein